MTVSSETSRKTFTGDGATVSFATSPMVFFAAADLDVYVVTTATGASTLLTLNTHYSVSGGDGSTGTVLTSGGSSPYGAPSAAQTLVIVRDVAITQGSDLVNNDNSDAEVLEDGFDRLTMIAQQADQAIERSFKLADSDVSGASTALPTPVASKLIGWDSAGTALRNYAATDFDTALTTEFTLTLLDDADAGEFFQTLVDGATAETAPAIGDTIMLSDVSLTPDNGRKMTLANLLKVVQGLKFGGALIVNGTVTRSVGASALTVALKGFDGSDPSATNPVYVLTPTITSSVFDGGYVFRTVTSALSMTVSSGSTLGHTSAVAGPVYVYLIDNAGTLELAVSGRFFGGASVQSSTAEGGAGGADAHNVLYSTTARTNVACVCLQRWKSTQTTAGTWAATTGEVQLYPFPFKAPKRTVFTSSSTYTKDWDALAVHLYAKAGGGSGGGSSGATARGGSGGEGEEGWRVIDQSTAPATNTVTIPAAATAIGANTNSAGNAGGTVSVGSLMSCGGGIGGTSGNSGGAAGLGGTGGASADYFMPGSAGQVGSDSGGSVVAMNHAGGGKGGGGSGLGGVANSGGGGGGGTVGTASGAGGTGVAVVTEHYSS